jgi:glycosyltransferase involved in cell wall biosynthesis
MADVPLVSVGVPVYNGELTIARALDSLLAQDLDDIEIIVSDNASDDGTPEICAEYATRDPRIRLFRNPRNLGLAGNFNRTFELARGTYFKWATHDDWHAPESLRLTAKALDENPAASLCATGVSLVDEYGVEFDRWVPPADLEEPAPHVRMGCLLRSLGETHPMYGLVRSSALRQTHLMQSYVGSDRTLLAELSVLGPFVQVADVMHFYTVSATARRDYRPSLTYDPANAARLPLRTWRLIYEHLGVVWRADVSAGQKMLLVGSVLRRFGIGDARRLAAEAYHTARILAWRARRRHPRPGPR